MHQSVKVARLKDLTSADAALLLWSLILKLADDR